MIGILKSVLDRKWKNRGKVISESILKEVLYERRRQDLKWGEQNHPLGIEKTTWSSENESLARLSYECSFKAGKGTWKDVLEEEYAELLNSGSTKELRIEAIQCAAVLVAMIECMDRNKLK